MWLCNSSVGRKVVMSVTGICLILFLTFHMAMNLVALISESGYNWICEILGSNWYAVAATLILAALFIIHFFYAFWLSLQNLKARGSEKYAVTSKPKSVEWASQNMLVLGIIVILGLALHLINFWSHMMLPDLLQEAGVQQDLMTLAYSTNGIHYIKETFSNPIYAALYIIWLGALWFHLTHGFWSALQTLGWNNRIWFNRWRVIGNIYTTCVVAVFAIVVIAFYIQSLL